MIKPLSAFLGDLLRVAKDDTISDIAYADLIEEKIIATRSMFVEYAGLFKDKRQLFSTMFTIAENGRFEEEGLENLVGEGVYDEKSLRLELSELVRQNILAYNPVTAIYSLQGKSMEHGLRMFVERIKKRDARQT